MLLRLLLLPVLFASIAHGEPPLNSRVLIVYDNKIPDSRAVAFYYGRARKIPTGNVCPVTVPDPNNRVVTMAEYVKNFRDPVRDCLRRVGLQQILYIVLAYCRSHTVETSTSIKYYALDSYLSDIWDVYGSRDFNPVPPAAHPYYAANRARDNVWLPFVSFAEWRAKVGSPLIYSVWRLDAATPDIARSLVDKAIRAETAHGPRGQACIDERVDPVNEADQGYRGGDWDLYRAAEFLSKAGIHVLEDKNDAEFGTSPAPVCPNTALYAGWYKLDHYNDAFQWNDGAIGFHLDSLSASDARSGPNWSANALRKGITVTAGAVNEPYLAGLPRPSGVFRDLLSGSNVGDAFLRNTRFLKWMILNFGDPLYTPFAGGRKLSH